MAELHTIDPLVRRIMDALFVLGLLSFIHVLWIPETHLARPQLVGLLALVAAGCWLIVRRGQQILPLVGLWLVSYAAMLLSAPTFFTLAVLIVFVRYGMRAGFRSVVVAGFAMVAGWLAMHGVEHGSRWVGTIHDILASLGNLAVSVVLGVSLVRLQRSLQQLATANRDLADSMVDLTEQSLAEQELTLAEERARAAKLLHEGLGDQLTTAGMSIDLAQRVSVDDPDRARDELAVARGQVGAALSDVRIWVRAMNPANRHSEAGLAGLHDLAASFRGTGLQVEVDLQDTPPPLTPLQGQFITRFVQEGLTNAVQHGRASTVWIRVGHDRDQVTIELQDDGAGAIGVPFEGFGLRSVRELAGELGGGFQASGGGAGGFVIRAMLPLAGRPQATAESVMVEAGR